eukprot:XP_001704103.1 Hypothetical protein GL50803_37071 [Giardia lamblia ATCC 50803]
MCLDLLGLHGICLPLQNNGLLKVPRATGGDLLFAEVQKCSRKLDWSALERSLPVLQLIVVLYFKLVTFRARFVLESEEALLPRSIKSL